MGWTAADHNSSQIQIIRFNPLFTSDTLILKRKFSSGLMRGHTLIQFSARACGTLCVWKQDKGTNPVGCLFSHLNRHFSVHC